MLSIQRNKNKFTKKRDNLNLIRRNQRVTYNKIGLGYESKIMLRVLVIFVMLIKPINVIYLNVTIMVKNGHIILFCFVE